MTTYEDLLIEADCCGLIAREKSLLAHNGRIKGKRIAINRSLTETEKKCVMAKELGHYYTGTEDLLDQSFVSNRKQELRGRVYAYNKIVGLMGIIDDKHHCRDLAESAKHLNVTEDFLQEALSYYKGKYGISAKIDNYVVFLNQQLQFWN